jgi:hypothetical protein
VNLALDPKFVRISRNGVSNLQKMSTGGSDKELDALKALFQSIVPNVDDIVPVVMNTAELIHPTQSMAFCPPKMLPIKSWSLQAMESSVKQQQQSNT